jgi:hypothetical protein
MSDSTKNSANSAPIINYKTKSRQKANCAPQNITKKEKIKNILIDPEISRIDLFYYYD